MSQIKLIIIAGNLPVTYFSLIIIQLICFFNTSAQVLTWQQVDLVNQINGIQSSVTATTTDATGNVFLTGFFTGSIDIGTTRLNSLGYQDVFVARSLLKISGALYFVMPFMAYSSPFVAASLLG